jgi:hypothetical protein
MLGIGAASAPGGRSPRRHRRLRLARHPHIPRVGVGPSLELPALHAGRVGFPATGPSSADPSQLATARPARRPAHPAAPARGRPRPLPTTSRLDHTHPDPTRPTSPVDPTGNISVVDPAFEEDPGRAATARSTPVARIHHNGRIHQDLLGPGRTTTPSCPKSWHRYHPAHPAEAQRAAEASGPPPPPPRPARHPPAEPRKLSRGGLPGGAGRRGPRAPETRPPARDDRTTARCSPHPGSEKRPRAD